MNAVGVDVGGTKIAAGVVSPEGELLSEVRYPTENGRERLLSTIAEAIAKVERGYEVGGVYLAVPGFILARAPSRENLCEADKSMSEQDMAK